jgi:hypothetical protein
MKNLMDITDYVMLFVNLFVRIVAAVTTILTLKDK